MKSGKRTDHDNEIPSIKIRGFQSLAEIDHGNWRGRPRRGGTEMIAVYTWAFARDNSEYQDAGIDLSSTQRAHPKNPTLKSGVSCDEHIFSRLDGRESERALRVRLRRLCYLVGPDWTQAD